MPIKWGTQEVEAIKYGTTTITKVYSGSTLIWPAKSYLTQAADLGDNRFQSAAAINMSDSDEFTFVVGIETPSSWISPAIDQYIISFDDDRAYLRVRSSDRALLYRAFDSSATKVVEILSSLTLSLSTKYLIGISHSAAVGNQLWISGSSASMAVDQNTGGTANWSSRNLTIGGQWNSVTRNFQGRIGPLWVKPAREDLSNAWPNYHDGTGFLDAQNGAFIRMPWDGFTSDGSSSASFSVLGGGSVTLGAW